MNNQVRQVYVSTISNSTMDFLSPFYLHHSDNPGTILVSQPLNGDNYPSWSRAVWHLVLKIRLDSLMVLLLNRIQLLQINPFGFVITIWYHHGYLMPLRLIWHKVFCTQNLLMRFGWILKRDFLKIMHQRSSKLRDPFVH